MSEHSAPPPYTTVPTIKTRRYPSMVIWIIPILAALIGLIMLINSTLESGPRIKISFQTAEGLEINKTPVKYKNVVIGKVTGIELAQDRSHVIATVDLNSSASFFATEKSLFWVVRPRIGVSGISGVDTLLSGAFIAADAGPERKPQTDFVGLEIPPPITYGERGKRFTLFSQNLGSLDIGSPVYYRRIKVGQVTSYKLSEDGKGVDLDIFIDAPNDKYVSTESRFWNASGVDVSVGADGLKVNTESLSSILAGGLAFLEPAYSSDPVTAEEGARFELFNDQEAALAPPDGKAHFISMNFKQPLRGLEINAPVEFLGVKIGRVVSVNLDYDPASKSFPSMVGAIIYPDRLGKAHKRLVDLNGGKDDENAAAVLLATFVKQGLRAQAKTGNLITGQLYISLDFTRNPPPVVFDASARPLHIPTVAGDMDKVQEQLLAVVDKISKVPLDKIAINLNDSLSGLKQTINQVNTELLPQVNGTLQKTQETLASVNASLSADSPERQQLGQLITEVERAARSIRVLTDSLSRHPESLIRGRNRDGAVDDVERSTPQSNRQP
ncbi:PqiB protein [Pseudomonas amygdali pv. mori]|uniref:PqiB protein n=1 Tax=Pseudomonas amygdali pv. mori TaxID=34065 RepID=A0A3M5JHI6_PSEA0|nr:MlaD family protein [Pseudomonas amygdali]RMT22412.1 PqiB protein [Pseudomonas amygdali pv. mori]